MRKAITKKLVANDDRMDFLPSKLPKHNFKFEQLVYLFMDRFCENYKGGYWDFYTLSNNGFYIKLDSDNSFKVCNPDNFFDSEMSTDSACIGVNLYAFNYLSWTAHEDNFNQLFYWLTEYAKQHVEAGKILKFID